MPEVLLWAVRITKYFGFSRGQKKKVIISISKVMTSNCFPYPFSRKLMASALCSGYKVQPAGGVCSIISPRSVSLQGHHHHIQNKGIFPLAVSYTNSSDCELSPPSEDWTLILVLLTTYLSLPQSTSSLTEKPTDETATESPDLHFSTIFPT